MLKIKHKFFLFSALSIYISAFASEQNYFNDALKYTVQVKTTIKWPSNDESRGTSKGAGFLIDKERGYILTNAHVIGRSASLVSVNFINESHVFVEKVYVDPFIDIGIIKIDPEKIPKSAKEAKLNCTGHVEPGIAVGAMGHPGGFAFTATRGVISGVTSKLQSELIQTDAPINPGNSGGPLINLKTGYIEGINTSIIKGSQNTNFATSSHYACKIISLLNENKNPSPFNNGWVFIKEEDEPKNVRIAKKLYDKYSLSVQPGDKIIKANNIIIKNETQLINAIRGATSNTKIIVIRDGKEIELSGDLNVEDYLIKEIGYHMSGAFFSTVEEKLKLDLNLESIGVGYVETGSRAENSDISKNDFIFTVDGETPISMEHFIELLKKAMDQKKESVKLILKRIGVSSGGLFGYIERSLPLSDVFVVTEKDPMGTTIFVEKK